MGSVHEGQGGTRALFMRIRKGTWALFMRVRGTRALFMRIRKGTWALFMRVRGTRALFMRVRGTRALFMRRGFQCVSILHHTRRLLGTNTELSHCDEVNKDMDDKGQQASGHWQPLKMLWNRNQPRPDRRQRVSETRLGAPHHSQRPSGRTRRLTLLFLVDDIVTHPAESRNTRDPGNASTCNALTGV
ncbi:hypothetical protein EYF80_026257 [Liparis tanakae]|uniref:Uncharacterized protein n=1 Tax=Liparis tanakae TaxID=230148 RepID=A0A4Z2HE19_9TELE|nr:hypothetical protein EYF80_026257 [Liparis tanakae]